jgi:hypothetical protein
VTGSLLDIVQVCTILCWGYETVRRKSDRVTFSTGQRHTCLDIEDDQKRIVRYYGYQKSDGMYTLDNP